MGTDGISCLTDTDGHGVDAHSHFNTLGHDDLLSDGAEPPTDGGTTTGMNEELNGNTDL